LPRAITAIESASMTLLGIPTEFYLFAATLASVALFHHKTLQVAVTGLIAIVLFKYFGPGFREGAGLEGLLMHVEHEWATLANLFLLLTGFAVVARRFEVSRVPDEMPALLPNDWKGGAVLLGIIFIISGFLDNIAAALIGGMVAKHVYKGKVHISFLAAMVAASNAGGAGSVIGDTTTTMMWIAGISPLAVVHGYIGAFAAFSLFAVPAALQQHRYQPILKDPPSGLSIDYPALATVAFILIAAVSVNILGNAHAPQLMERVPAIGAAVWVAILLMAIVRPPDWKVAFSAVPGTVFLMSLVLAASLMPIESLPHPRWQTAFGLGVLSSVFDNIPLTALALHQGGYDWGVLAYAVGFGGSMIWFGSSAGVALSNSYPEAKSAWNWLRSAWYVPFAYVFGFIAMMWLLGWNPPLPALR
jgi:Na+/H+ antiporter NhaD/arsenite permease-like protein